MMKPRDLISTEYHVMLIYLHPFQPLAHAGRGTAHPVLYSQNVQPDPSTAKPCRYSQRMRTEQTLRLPLWQGFNGLVDLPQVAFGIGKVRRA